MKRARVVVVGGGISGLAAAWRLVHPLGGDDGSPRPEVVVLDAAPRPGGKLRLGEVGGVGVDVGAESVLARRPEAVSLLREAGLGDDLVHPQPRSASIVSRRALHRMPAGTVMGVPAGPDAVRAMAGLLDADELARAGRETLTPPVTEDVSVASWVAGRVGRAVVDRLVEPLLGGVYAGHADQLSLEVTVPQLWPRATAGAPLLEPATPRDAAGGAAGAAGDAPGAQGAAAAPGGAGPVFAGVRGGVGRVPEVLVAGLRARGVEVRSGVTVRALRRGAAGWELETGPVPAPEHLSADAVVLAVPAAAAARLLAGVSGPASSRLGGVGSASVAVIAAAVPREQFAGIDGSGLLVPPVEGTAVKAATFSSNKWAWVGEGSDLVVVRLSLGRAGEVRTLQRDDDELTALALADLGGMLGRPIRPVDTLVTRWGGALPQYAVGHRARTEAVRAAVAQLPGLALCGAHLDGVGIPACIASAERAVRELDLTAVTGRIDA